MTAKKTGRSQWFPKNRRRFRPEAVKKLSSDRREGEQQLLKVARPFGIARVPRLFFFAVEPSYAGISCSVRFRPNHLVRL